MDFFVRLRNIWFQFYIGKQRRNFDYEIDYLVVRTPILSIFLTKSIFVLREGLDRLRLVFWLGNKNQITKQVFLW